jgi:cell division topological specificity factor
VIVAHQRSESQDSKLNSADYLKKLQLEIMEVIRKYVEIDQDQVKVELSQNDDCSVIELNLTLPENQ